MAVQTIVWASLADDSGQASFEVDVDDTSDPLNWDVLTTRVVNGMARPAFCDMRRGNGQAWFTTEIPGGDTRSQNTGGPVRKMSDLPYMLARTS